MKIKYYLSALTSVAFCATMPLYGVPKKAQEKEDSSPKEMVDTIKNHLEDSSLKDMVDAIKKHLVVNGKGIFQEVDTYLKKNERWDLECQCWKTDAMCILRSTIPNLLPKEMTTVGLMGLCVESDKVRINCRIRTDRHTDLWFKLCFWLDGRYHGRFSDKDNLPICYENENISYIEGNAFIGKDENKKKDEKIVKKKDEKIVDINEIKLDASIEDRERKEYWLLLKIAEEIEKNYRTNTDGVKKYKEYICSDNNHDFQGLDAQECFPFLPEEKVWIWNHNAWTQVEDKLGKSVLVEGCFNCPETNGVRFKCWFFKKSKIDTFRFVVYTENVFVGCFSNRMGAGILIVPSKTVKAAKRAIKKSIIMTKEPVKSLKKLIGDDAIDEDGIDPKVKFFLVDVKD